MVYCKAVLLLGAIMCLVAVQCVHRTLDEAKEVRERLVKKYIKRLKKEDGAVQLVGGANEFEGNVEILHNGKWGAVCDDEWDANEAEVVCRQLGFVGHKKATHSGLFGPIKRKFWMDNVLCDGNESELVNCRFDGWGSHDCDGSEAAGVVCKSRDEPETPKPIAKRKHSKHHLHKKHQIEIRLNGGRSSNEGRVEIRFGKSMWGTVCSDGWSLLEANVVCKSLRLGFAHDALQTDFFNATKYAATPVLSGTECWGNETSLADCMHHSFGEIVCPGPANHVAAVICEHRMADLVFDYHELEHSAHLEDRPIYFLQCAMEENCLASQAYVIQRENPNWHQETRRLLKFTATVLNAGTADFRPSIPKELWEWHMCHMHYHSMEVFAVFNIFNTTGGKVAEGHKASFCLEDNQCNPDVEPKYACANYGDQGISVNCSDIYRYNIDCQWVDITDLEPGLYTMQVSVNPEFKVAEMSYDNNSAVCKLLYTETYVRVFDCELQRPRDL